MAPLIAAATPLLAELVKNGFNLIAGAVQAKGKDLIEEKLGVKLDDVLGTEEGKLKLKQLEIQHEEFLLDNVLKNRQLDLSFVQEDAKDRASARDMNTRINESEHATWLSKNIPAILALIVVCSSITILAFTAEADVRIAAVGLATLVLGFYFGSNRDSSTKNDTIQKLAGRQQ